MEQPKVDSNLMMLASFGDRVGLEKCVESEESDITQPDQYGRSPLHWSARAGRNDCCQYLIETNVDKNSSDVSYFRNNIIF